VRLPIVNREIPIIEDDYVVLPVKYGGDENDPKAVFATGFLKVTPAHDPNDYEIGRRHDLPVINVLAPDGTISDQHGWPADDFAQGDAGFLLGQDRFEARAAVVEWFKKNRLLEDVKEYRHSVGHSYRSHVPIEPYLSDQWYCKVTDDRLAGAALRAMSREQFDGGASRGTGVPPVSPTPGSENSSSSSRTQHGQDARATGDWQGQLKFFPARYAKTFQTWHENIRDWCISRQLWWGHRIPVWRLPEGRLADRLSPQQFEAMVEQLTAWATADRIAMTMRSDDPAARAADIADLTLPFTFVCVRDPNDREIIGELERVGAAQDPDVLDTWFSSGLWPLSTLGWPDESADLETWNPGNVLCTAREIITLWVSRMVMFNLYFRGCLPFTDVVIHAMIQDGEGRKMSKTLGNGVDPLDIIHSHGSDAMRYTLCAMATNTQDVRMPVERDSATGKNTSPKFDIGRNFCNKVWNAVRFALMNLGSVTTTEKVDETKWSLADRWIVSRFNRTVAACDEALGNYRFDQYAKTCYDFFWGDLCDWYLEAIKPAMRDPARAPHTANVLAAVLDGALRLMHPMIPFITETIWWKLNDVRPARGLPNRLECPPSPRLITAAWPKVGEFAEAAEHIFPKLQEVVTALRNLRNENKVDPKRTVSVTVNAPDEPARQILENREMIELLAMCRIEKIGAGLPAPERAARASAAGVELFVSGLADEAAEQQRLAKRREELNKQITALRGRLSNESYTKKAPPHLVKQTQDQLAEAEAELTKLG
jgi:valyl-tRNA synthetase